LLVYKLNATLAMVAATVLAAVELTQASRLKVARSIACLGDLAKLRRQWRPMLKSQLTRL
jgi:hypothetical protein